MNSQERSQYDVNQSKSEDSINAKDFLIGALIGGMAGAAAALFLAPKSGKELRNNLNEQALVLKDKTEQFRETAMTKGNELATVAKEKTNSLSQTVSKQSNELVSKVKNLKKEEDLNEQAAENGDVLETETGNSTVNDAEIQLKLEETKKAFDETEEKYNH